MKRIKVYIFSVLFCCCVFSVRASGEYNSILAQINQKLLDLNTFVNEIDVNIQFVFSMLEDTYYEIADINANSSSINTSLTAIKTRCDEFKTLLQSSVSDLDEISSYMQASSSTLNYILDYNSTIETQTHNIDANVDTLCDYMSNLKDLASALPDIKDQLQSIVDQGQLNKEETQLQVLSVLQGITDQADSIKEALDILTQDDSVTEITGAIASLKDEIKAILRLLNTWDQGFFRYLYDRTFPTQSFEFYHISGSPFFENGYLTYDQPIGYISTFSFVDWLAQVLSSQVQGMQVINDNILFIAKVLGTNAQEQAMAEFQEDADDTVNTVTSQYSELINSSVYTPKQFDFSKTKLQNVRNVISGLSGGNGYESVKVHNLAFASFEPFGFPTQVDYKYDLTHTSSFWEVCRAFFTCVWVMLFASVFFMVVRMFYKFYHICFNALAGNRAAGYEVSNIPLHW